MNKRKCANPAFPPGTGAPATRAFEGIGVTEFRQLAGRSEKELLQLHGVGLKSIQVIRTALQELGLDLI